MTFTGLVKTIGYAVFDSRTNILYVRVTIPDFWKREEVGASIAINGCCLTLLKETTSSVASFFIMEESRRIIHLEDLEKLPEGKTGDEYLTQGPMTGESRPYGTPVNVEPALRQGDPFGGHHVTGHIDCVESMHEVDERADGSTDIWISRPAKSFIIHKGSITVDGVSLTVAEVKPEFFRVSIIPHTKESTNLQFACLGRKVNLEFDSNLKMVVKLLQDPEYRAQVEKLANL